MNNNIEEEGGFYQKYDRVLEDLKNKLKEVRVRWCDVSCAIEESISDEEEEGGFYQKYYRVLEALKNKMKETSVRWCDVHCAIQEGISNEEILSTNSHELQDALWDLEEELEEKISLWNSMKGDFFLIKEEIAKNYHQQQELEKLLSSLKTDEVTLTSTNGPEMDPLVRDLQPVRQAIALAQEEHTALKSRYSILVQTYLRIKGAICSFGDLEQRVQNFPTFFCDQKKVEIADKMYEKVQEMEEAEEIQEEISLFYFNETLKELDNLTW